MTMADDVVDDDDDHDMAGLRACATSQLEGAGGLCIGHWGGHFEYQTCHLKRLRAAANRFLADALTKASLFAISCDVIQLQIITRTLVLYHSFIFGHTARL